MCQELVHSGAQQYFNAYANSRYTCSQNYAEAKRKFEEGKREWIVKADEPAILSQPRHTLEKKYSLARKHYNAYYNYVLNNSPNEYDIYRSDLRIYQYGGVADSEEKDPHMDVITFIDMAAGRKYYIFRELFETWYFNNSGIPNMYNTHTVYNIK